MLTKMDAFGMHIQFIYLYIMVILNVSNIFTKINILDTYVCNIAAQKGRFECIKYIYENGCHWNTSTYTIAVRYGHIKCLKYAHKNGYCWNTNTINYAVQYGQLECLKYLHEKGCP
jgi:hypothetical protein